MAQHSGVSFRPEPLNLKHHTKFHAFFPGHALRRSHRIEAADALGHHTGIDHLAAGLLSGGLGKLHIQGIRKTAVDRAIFISKK